MLYKYMKEIGDLKKRTKKNTGEYDRLSLKCTTRGVTPRINTIPSTEYEG